MEFNRLLACTFMYIFICLLAMVSYIQVFHKVGKDKAKFLLSGTPKGRCHMMVKQFKCKSLIRQVMAPEIRKESSDFKHSYGKLHPHNQNGRESQFPENKQFNGPGSFYIIHRFRDVCYVQACLEEWHILKADLNQSQSN